MRTRMFETPTSGVLKSDDDNLPVFFSEGWEQLLEISSDSNAIRLAMILNWVLK